MKRARAEGRPAVEGHQGVDVRESRSCMAAPRYRWIRSSAAFFLVLVALDASGAELELTRLEAEALERLQRYLRVDTINPPGNEWRAVEFLGGILAAEGIAFESAETAPGRGNLWARLEGGDEPALVLLHHSDVVPADERFWDHGVLSGALEDGYVFGRGALDTKGLGILHLQTFLTLHRRGLPLRRDVIFMVTADEEAGGRHGAGWMLAHRPEVFDGVGFVLNEGGSGSLLAGRPAFSVEVTQKVPLWLRLVSRGQPGHGSTPRADSSVSRLIRGLGRLEEYEFAPRVVPAVETYFRGLGQLYGGEIGRHFANLPRALDDPEFVTRLQAENPRLHALLRNTCSLTRLQGSSKINVVPAEAWAELDCRLLPDQDPDEFIALLTGVLAEPQIRIERLMAFAPALSSADTELYRVIEEVCKRHFPRALVVPSVVAGFTDSHFFRDLGIASYGFSPALLSSEEAAGIHGNNERISVENLRRGVRMMLEIVERLVY